MKIRLLDCTLRDGGYVNNWNFGNNAIRSIAEMLSDANIDIIECGFLKDTLHDDSVSLFSTVSEIKSILPADRKDSEFVAMAAPGDYSAERLEPCDGTSVTGIRVIFHDNEADEALSYCSRIMEKGYKAFFQPMNTVAYSDRQLLNLVERVNALEPYAFYIVDTLGIMDQRDIERLSYLLDNNLTPNIALGLHSHNNLQLSFSNAQKFLGMNMSRTRIVDASIYGMGRGAGNLSTELIAHYVNEAYETTYNIEYLLKIYDKYIRKIRELSEWGYSVAYYLAAVHKCHPNYAKFLLNRGTLPINDVGNILMSVADERRHLYDEKYILHHYQEYQNNQIDDTAALTEFKRLINGRPVLIIAPGKTLLEHIKDIRGYIDSVNPYIISVNHKSELIMPDAVFISNRKRYDEMITRGRYVPAANTFITSNIKDAANTEHLFNYSDLCNTGGKFIDNAAIMLLKLLTSAEPDSTTLAGMDGFSADTENYYAAMFDNTPNAKVLFEINRTVHDAIAYYKRKMRIVFLTPSMYNKDSN